jgi:predicted Fe-Mo cluster-binding NifX family protein
LRIAAVSDDGTHVSEHFGRAPYYVVLTVEDGRITHTETRPKAGHHSFAAQGHATLAPGERHGYDAASQVKHRAMAEPITDCQALLAGGMGWGAFESLEAYSIELVITDVRDIREAALLYSQGKLPNLMDRLH